MCKSLLPWAVTVIATVVAGCDEDSVEVSASVSASASVATAESPKVVQFVALPVEVGQKWQTSRDSVLDVSVEFWTESQRRYGTAESHREEKAELEDEVLARVGKWPGKVRATYSVYRSKEVHPDRGASDSSALEGRTFILDHMDEEPKAATADGGALTDEERSALWLHHVDLGKAHPLVSQLSSRPIPVGKDFPLRSALFEALIGVSTGEFQSGRVRIDRIERVGDREIAVIEWSAKMRTKEQNHMVTDWDMEATTKVEVRPARLVSQRIDATLTVSGRTRKDGQWLRMVGDGRMKDRRTWSYGK